MNLASGRARELRFNDAGSVVDTSEAVYLHEYQKSPKEFFEALAEGDLLQPCRLELEQAGYPWILPSSSAKIFVRPHQWERVVEAVAGKDLRMHHVIVAEEFADLVQETVRRIRSRSRPKLKQRSPLKLASEDAPKASASAADPDTFALDMYLLFQRENFLVHTDVCF